MSGLPTEDRRSPDPEWRRGNWRTEAGLRVGRPTLEEGAAGERSAWQDWEDFWKINLVETSEAEEERETGGAGAAVREPADDAVDPRGTPAAAEETSSGGADLREAGERPAEKDWGNQIADSSETEHTGILKCFSSKN